MGTGLDNIPESDSGGGGDFIRTIKVLEDQESCRIRFLTDHDEIFFERFHSIREKGVFRGFKVCVDAALGKPCGLCDEDDWAGMQYLAWVFELTHDYPDKPKGEYEKVEVGSQTLYRVQVNEPRLMRYSITHSGGLKTRAKRAGTLLDREFEWIRSGVAGTKRPSYVLEADDKSKMPRELVKLAGELPTLEDVAFGRVESLDGSEVKERKRRDDDEDESPRTRRRREESDDEEDDDNGEAPF